MMQKSRFICKEATIHDAKTIHNILLKSFQPYKKIAPRKAYSETVMTPDEIRDRIEKNEFEVYIILFEHQIIGTFSFTLKPNINMYLRSMAVIPDFQNKGVGLYIIEKIFEIAWENNYSMISLDTSIILKNAIGLYEKFGFKKTGKTTDFYGITIIEMKKKL